jgi:nucleotide-binding universal stress UspA family protein/hemerythrin-like domain-containing protein
LIPQEVAVYHHLLVPVDDTDLSVEVVGNAVALARPLGARITFFHAVADAAASLRGAAEVLRPTARDEYEYQHLGKARELLTKAEAAARALGVPCESRHAVSDKPAQAIAEAARAGGCDLIFMASHGGRDKLGVAFASETLTVLMTAGLPVLVSSTGEPKAPARAIAIIRDERRSVAAVMHAWMHALATAREAGSAPDVALMRAIVRYVQNSPMKLHHPAEGEHLFRRLRERTTSCNAELDELERQHERDEQLVAALARQVEALATASAADRSSATRALDEGVARYAAFLWDHLGREEGVILPAAQRHLLPEDWAAIDAAFAANRDPNFGGDTDKAHRQLFSRIVNFLTPSPAPAATRSRCGCADSRPAHPACSRRPPHRPSRRPRARGR